MNTVQVAITKVFSASSVFYLRLFHFFGKLLKSDKPWEIEPKSLPQVIFNRMPDAMGVDSVPCVDIIK
jgi:hypothetical protein